MSDAGLNPFADDSAVLVVGGLTIENGCSSMVVHGDLTIMRDVSALGPLDELISALQAIRASIADGGAADDVASSVSAVDEVANPFG